MNKKGMTIVTLLIIVSLTFIATKLAIIAIEKFGTDIKESNVAKSYYLKNIQQQANSAFAKVYFENLTKGVRKNPTVVEIKRQLIQSGLTEENLSRYDIVVKDGNVLVSVKEKKN